MFVLIEYFLHCLDISSKLNGHLNPSAVPDRPDLMGQLAVATKLALEAPLTGYLSRMSPSFVAPVSNSQPAGNARSEMQVCACAPTSGSSDDVPSITVESCVAKTKNGSWPSGVRTHADHHYHNGSAALTRTPAAVETSPRHKAMHRSPSHGQLYQSVGSLSLRGSTGGGGSAESLATIVGNYQQQKPRHPSQMPTHHETRHRQPPMPATAYRRSMLAPPPTSGGVLGVRPMHGTACDIPRYSAFLLFLNITCIFR